MAITNIQSTSEPVEQNKLTLN